MRKLLEDYRQAALDALVKPDAMVYILHDVHHTKEITKSSIERLTNVHAKIEALRLVLTFIDDVKQEHVNAAKLIESAPSYWGETIEDPSDLQLANHLSDAVLQSIQKLKATIKD